MAQIKAITKSNFYKVRKRLCNVCCGSTIVSNIATQVSSKSLRGHHVTTKRSEWRVVGHTNRLALPQTFLDFCGSFPIYSIEQTSSDSMMSSLTSSLKEGTIDVVNVITKMKGIAPNAIFSFSPQSFVDFAMESQR